MSRYRVVKGWKYQLLDDYIIPVGIKPVINVDTQFLKLNRAGVLIIKRFYAWDGPSGPTIDTPDFMRGSLVHDGLYQLMRVGVLSPKLYRKRADQLLHDICIQDGMCRFRAWYVYWAVRLFAGISARPGTEKPLKICNLGGQYVD
ncbi:MAG: hypothetical protein WC417_07305 [Candidatus Omnitrophota bacterium]|jgi:hypothetical protein